VIRVNLLPQKRGARGQPSAPSGSQAWLLVVLGVVLVEAIGLFLYHQGKQSELAAQVAKNAKVEGDIKDIQKMVANHDEVKKQLAVLRSREDAIAKLQSARSGPTAVLLELAQLLTKDKGPTADADQLQQLKKVNPLAVYNPGWDVRRLWLTSYVETDRVVKIEGQARDGNDVSELAQRLKLSVYFYDVALLPGKKEADKDSKLDVVNFSLQLKVRY
jgi:type IV pilus assembly protein PilN